MGARFPGMPMDARPRSELSAPNHSAHFDVNPLVLPSSNVMWTDIFSSRITFSAICFVCLFRSWTPWKDSQKAYMLLSPCIYLHHGILWTQ